MYLPHYPLGPKRKVTNQQKYACPQKFQKRGKEENHDGLLLVKYTCTKK